MAPGQATNRRAYVEPLFRGACARTLVAWEEETGGVREGKGKDEIEKPWDRAPPRNTHNRAFLLFTVLLSGLVDALPYLLQSGVFLSVRFSLSVAHSLVFSLSRGNLHVIQIECFSAHHPSCPGLYMF